MNVDTKFPGTLEERLALGPDIVRMPASWQEYLDLLEEDCAFPVEYDNEEIILMSIASDPHEVIVMNIGTCLNNAFTDMPDLAVRGSNRHIYIPELKKDYAPDAHVIQGAPVLHQLRKGLTANTNPWLVVEVLSPSTFVRDIQEKLPAYKKIASLRHILYIHQDRPLVTVFNRVSDAAVWETLDFERLEDSFLVAGVGVSLGDVYRKVGGRVLT